jgi:hypothetical protein
MPSSSVLRPLCSLSVRCKSGVMHPVARKMAFFALVHRPVARDQARALENM